MEDGLTGTSTLDAAGLPDCESGVAVDEIGPAPAVTVRVARVWTRIGGRR